MTVLWFHQLNLKNKKTSNSTPNTLRKHNIFNRSKKQGKNPDQANKI